MQDMIPQGTPGPPEGSGYEHSDVGLRGILIAGGVLTLVTVATMAILGGWYAAMSYRERQQLNQRPPRFADDSGQFPEPRLQGKPLADMLLLREREQAQLAGYGWVDREAGIARIPIARALELAPALLADEQPKAANTPAGPARTERPSPPEPATTEEPKAEAPAPEPKAEEAKAAPTPAPEPKAEEPAPEPKAEEPGPEPKVEEPGTTLPEQVFEAPDRPAEP